MYHPVLLLMQRHLEAEIYQGEAMEEKDGSDDGDLVRSPRERLCGREAFS